MSEYYEMLGVTREASETEIKKAYRKLGARAPSGSEPRPGRRGTLQGDHRGLRGAAGSPEAGDVRPLRESGAGWRGRLRCSTMSI